MKTVNAEKKERDRIGITEYRIGAPIGKDLKLVYLSDLHGYPNEPISDAILKLRPDAILVGGDFISEKGDPEYEAGFLGFAAKTAPTFCVLGNHETRLGSEAVSRLKDTVTRSGAVLLDNAYVGFGGLFIGGLTSGMVEKNKKSERNTPAPDIGWLGEFSSLDGYKILLSHHPEYFDRYIGRLPIDLTFSGHAHGGQWRFFGRGIYSPGQGFFPKYTYGLYGGRLIVSRGIGNHTYIGRINNGPEIVSVVLEAKKRG